MRVFRLASGADVCPLTKQLPFGPGNQSRAPIWRIRKSTGTVVRPLAAERRVVLEGTSNARDLGGLEMQDGRTVKAHLVYRSDDLSGLTDEGLQDLAALGIRLLCDFRGPDSVENAPNRLPGEHQIEVLHLPLLNPENDISEGVREAFEKKDGAVLRKCLGHGEASGFMIDGYRSMIENGRDHFALVLKRLAAGDTPVLFHCTAGKDRTGVCAALILWALGASDETVMADYLLSNVYRSKYVEDALREISTFMEDAELMRPIYEVRPEYLRAAMEAIRDGYGTVENYLSTGLGLDEETLEALRDRLLEPNQKTSLRLRVGRKAHLERPT